MAWLAIMQATTAAAAGRPTPKIIHSLIRKSTQQEGGTGHQQQPSHHLFLNNLRHPWQSI